MAHLSVLQTFLLKKWDFQLSQLFKSGSRFSTALEFSGEKEIEIPFVSSLTTSYWKPKHNTFLLLSFWEQDFGICRFCTDIPWHKIAQKKKYTTRAKNAVFR